MFQLSDGTPLAGTLPSLFPFEEISDSVDLTATIPNVMSDFCVQGQALDILKGQTRKFEFCVTVTGKNMNRFLQLLNF